MGPDLELKGKSETVMEVTASKENGIVSRHSEDKFMPCTSNCEDVYMEPSSGDQANVQDPSGDEYMEPLSGDQANVQDASGNVYMEPLSGDQANAQDASGNVYMEPLSGDQAHVQDGNEDVDVTDCMNYKEDGLVEDQRNGSTESSSSFGNTLSGTENDSFFSDGEVESQFCSGNATTSVFDGFGETFPLRKKKLTEHWKRFIRPLMWRCKWIELKMKACQSQALKYDRILAEYDQEKQCAFEKCTSEEFHTKSIPFSGQIRGSKIMKRKKRKRVEVTTDTASYMSRHNLFSYYENKRCDADLVFVDNCINLGVSTYKTNNGKNEYGYDNELSPLEFRNDDDSVEDIFSKIEVVRSRVRELKGRIDKVVSENPGKFISISKLKLEVSCDALNNSEQIPASSENGASSHGEMTPLTDVIDGMRLKQTTDGMLVNDHVVKEELHDLLELEKPDVPMEEQTTIPQVPFPVPGADLAAKTTASCVKPRSVPKSTGTKKQGRRKPRSNRWSRR